MICRLRLPFVAVSLCLTASALAGLSAPSLNSRSGATYTIYLDFAGFDFSNVTGADGTQGAWGYTGAKPGVVHAYDTDGDPLNFSADEVTAIKQTWAVVAQAYVGFNVNVTTVDPAPSFGGYAGKQTYYDVSAHFMHTSIGGDYNWFGGAGGVSYVGTTQDGGNFSGAHTNWVFGNGTANWPPYMGTAAAHEDGHGLSLGHQHDENQGGEYTLGDYNGNNFRANGTYGATMGAAYYTQRGAWRIGDPSKGNGNDVAGLQSNRDMGPLLDDGLGHSITTASALIVDNTGAVNAGAAQGWIMPLASTGYSAGSGVGDANAYTKDFFRFRAKGGLVTLTLNDGTEFLQTGIADPGATMRGVIRILDGGGNLIGTSIEDASTLFATYSGVLAAGDYYAEVDSYGAYISAYEPNSRYFNMGGYFLTGTGFAAVPEPATCVALGFGVLALLKRKRLV